jgi:hypothetical protein
MSNKKQRQQELEAVLNPFILSLDQALALAESNSPADETAHHDAASKAVHAIGDRIRCRFTGPRNFDRLTEGEQMVWHVTCMQAEVLNGGFHQYLTNSTGDTVEEVKVCLQKIGAIQTLELIQRLSQIFPEGAIPRDRDERCDAVEQWETKEPSNNLIDELTEGYYRQDENLNVLIVAFVRQHQDEFSLPSEEIVNRLRRKDRIALHYCRSNEPEWLGKADQSVKVLSDFVKVEQAKRDSDDRNELKLMAKAGKRSEAIQEYRKRFSCSLAEAKAAIDQLEKE